MLSHIVIGNRTLLPLKEAADAVSYTREYVAKLARDGKIAAAQINRQWYIDPASLNAFFENAQLEVKARNEYLRELRRQELEVKVVYESEVQAALAALETAPQRVFGKVVAVILVGCCAGVLLFDTAPLATPAQLAAAIEAVQPSPASSAVVAPVVPERVVPVERTEPAPTPSTTTVMEGELPPRSAGGVNEMP